MTLEEAIRLLNRNLDDPGSVDIMNLNKAQALSIEAMAEVKRLRSYKSFHVLNLLPGEAEK